MRRGIAAMAALVVALASIDGYLWYRSKYSRFPVHRLPSVAIFDEMRQFRTKADVETLNQALRDFLDHYKHLPLNNPSRQGQFSITLGHELNGVKPGENPANVEGKVFWSVPAGEQRDGWGHLYHIYFDHDADGWIDLGYGKLKGSFAVWSDGPNERDDMGAGDDVVGW